MELRLLDSQGSILPNTPHADAVLADLFQSCDDGDDGEEGADDDLAIETEDSTDDSESDDTSKNVALAAAFKKTRKNVNKRAGGRLPQRGKSDPGPPARKATRPSLVTSRKSGPK